MAIPTFTLPDTLRLNSSSSISPMYCVKSSTKLPSSSNVKLSGRYMVGASFTGSTVNVNTVLSVYSPSVTDILITTSPLKSSAGTIVNSSPDILTLTSWGNPLNASNVKSSPSTSSASKVITSGVSSLVNWESIADITGASFTGVTFISISSVATALPWESSTMNVKVSVPFQSTLELKLTVKPLISTWTFSLPVTLRLKLSSSISST